MTNDEGTWSEKGRGKRGAKRPPREPKDVGNPTTMPSRPSSRHTSADDDKTDTTSSAGSNVVRTPATDGNRKVARAAATAGQRDVSFLTRLGFPSLVAIICILGLLVNWYAWSNREGVQRPREGGVDHWHAVYGFYDCTLEGEDKYLAPFQSSVDASGIHSHGDGIIHIHPFGEASSGTNAKIKHFFNEMGVVVTPEKISLPTGAELVAGTECLDGSGPAEISMSYWQFDIQVIGENTTDPEVVSTDIGEHRFRNDREVYVISFAAAGTELPPPPAERFNTLNNVTPDIAYNPLELTPEDSGVTLEVEGDN